VGIVLGIAISPIAGVVALVVLTVVVALVAKRRATAAALRSVGAIDADPDRFPRLSNMVDGLCATLGLRPPRLMVVSDPVPNACAFGTTPDDAALVVTTGLLDTVDVLELEGVVAHELAHIKRHDSTVASIVVSMLGPFARMAGGDSLVHAALGHGREYRADQLASAAVRYPAGLHDALAALAARPPPVAGSVFEARRLAASRWVWIDPMVGRRNVVPADGELDATSVRVAALGEW